MTKMSESRCELRTPGKIAIGLAKAAGLDPEVIDELPKNANLNTGTGIPDGALVLSRSHLKYMGFPLHPLFQFVWRALNLHPMQLSPNSYLQLSAFLAFGLQEGVCIYPSDFFHFHDCVPTQDKGDYFHFTSKTNCKFFVKKPSSHKNWKRRPLLITRNWAAPELKFLKIPSTFATSGVKFTPTLNPERIQFLKTCFAGKSLDIEKYFTPTSLLQISQERSSIIYSHFQPLTDLKPKPGLDRQELEKRIFESLANTGAGFPCPEHVAEWESMRKRVEKRNKSGETDEAVHSVDIADVDQVESMIARQPPPLPCSLPSKPSKLDKKRSGSSALQGKKRLKPVLDPSAHSSRTCLEPIPPPTFSSLNSIPLNKKKCVALEKDDGTYVTEEEEVAGNPGARFAVFQSSFDAADASALQKKAPQEITEDITRFSELQQIITDIQKRLTLCAQNEDQLKAKLQKKRQRVRELKSQLHTNQKLLLKVQCSLSKLKNLRKKKYACDLKFKNAEHRILMESARHLNAGHRLKPGDYESCDSMEPSEEDGVEQDEEDDPEDEDDQDEEDEPEDEDDQDEEDDPEDEGEQDGNDDHDHNMSQVETSPNRNHPPLQSNQATLNTALVFDPESGTDRSVEHVTGFSHMGVVSSEFEFVNWNEFDHSAAFTYQSGEHVRGSYYMGGVSSECGFQNQNVSQVETSPNRNHPPLQSNQATLNTALVFDPESGTDRSVEHVTGFSHMGGVISEFEFLNRNEFDHSAPFTYQSGDHVPGSSYMGGVSSECGFQNQNVSQVETSPNRNHPPLQSNQATLNTALVFDPESGTDRSVEHVTEFSHIGGVSSEFEFLNRNEFDHSAPFTSQSGEHVPGSSYMAGVSSECGFQNQNDRTCSGFHLETQIGPAGLTVEEIPPEHEYATSMSQNQHERFNFNFNYNYFN